MKYREKGLRKALSILLAVAMLLTATIGITQTYALEDGQPVVTDSQGELPLGTSGAIESSGVLDSGTLPKETATPTDTSPGEDSTSPEFAEGYPKEYDGGVLPDLYPGCKRVRMIVRFLGEVIKAYCVVLEHDASPPSSSQVIAGKDSEDQDAIDYRHTDVDPRYSFNILSRVLPADDTTYDCWVVLEDNTGKLSEPKKVELKTPVKLLTDEYPRVGEDQPWGSKKVQILAKANGGESATAYYVAVADGAPEPSYSHLKSGNDSTGNPALAAGSVELSAGTEASEIVTLGEDDTNYDVYVVLSRNHYGGDFIDEIKSDIVKLDVKTPTVIAEEKICAIGDTQYATLDEALAVVQSGEEIKLLKNIDYNKGIVIEGKTVYFNLNGFTLNVTYLSGEGEIIAGLIVRNGAAIAVGEGEMNIKGHQWGVLATPDSTVTVTNAEATGGNGLSANGEHTTVTVTGNVTGTSEGVYADNKAKVTVEGNVSATRRAIYSATRGCEVTVRGDVIVAESEESLCGVDAFNDAKITVDGDITAVACGAKAELGGEIIVGGNITVTGTDNCGVWVNNSGQVSVEGTITAQNYIKLNDVIKLKSDGREDSSKPSYIKYTDDAGCVVWVKKTASATVFEVSTAEELKTALDSLSDGDTIKIMANIDYNDSVVISKAVTVDVGEYTLNITATKYTYLIGLDVSGSVDLISTTGALNVTGSNVGVRVWNGVAVSATVTNVSATQSGGIGIHASSIPGNTTNIVVQGNVTADKGVYAYGSGSTVIVHGKVTATNVGVLAENGGDILVHGAIKAETCGAEIVTSGTITARNGVAATGADGVGARLLNSGSMTIDGDITATNYINLCGTIKHKSDGVADPTKPGYTKYTDGEDRVVWVKAVPSTDITSSFTDLNFLRAVRAKLGKGVGDPIYTSDVAEVTSLDVSSKSIDSLAGIEHFTALITLNCSNNALKTLDVSRLTKLVNLYCDENQLTALDVSGLTELDVVRCSKNKLTTLNVSGLTKLTELSCYENQLTVLDVSSSTELVVVNCYENKLTMLNMSGLTKLVNLYCRANQLTALDVSGLTKLIELFCSENQLTELDVSRLPNLKQLYCSDNLLTRLVLNGSADYSHIDVRNNYMENESAVTGKNITWDNYRFRFSPQKAPQTTYLLIVQNGTGGGNYTKDSTVTIIANAASTGQCFKEWKVSPAVTFTGGTSKTDATAKFIMPAQAVTATAVYEALPSSHYIITVQDDGNGTASANVNSAAEDTEITLTATPNSGYRFKEWQVVSGGVSIVNNKFTMPSANVTVKAIFEPILAASYNVTVNGSYAGITGAGSYAQGSTITINAGTRSGYSFTGWTSFEGVIFANKNSATTSFIMPDKAVTVTANWAYIGNGSDGGSSKDTAKVDASITPKTADFDRNTESDNHKDVKVTLIVGNYTLSNIKLNGKVLEKDTDYTMRGSTVTIKKDYLARLDKGEKSFIFHMDGGKDLVLKVSVSDTRNPDTSVQIPFEDVTVDHWFTGNVMWAYEKGLMSGISKEPMLFAPHSSTTRGMVVTMLYRLEGKPTAFGNPFDDVSSDLYYADAVRWAYAENIVEGLSNRKFAPDNPVTREQMAVVLMNYAKAKGYDVSEGTDLAEYSDVGTISGWALDAMAWANAKGLIQGNGNNLMPGGNAERCHVAVIFQRFYEMYVK